MMGGYRRRGGRFPAIMAMALGSGFVLVMGLGKASSALGVGSIPIWLAAIAGAAYVLRGPLGAAILHAIANADQEREVAGTDPAVLQEIDDLRVQVTELQERVDFAERLLAREREMRPLGAGGGT